MFTVMNRRSEARWTMAELKLLGKVPDSVLARRIGRTIKEIVEERLRRRIRLVTPPRRWTARETKMLGHYFDEELARRFRRPVHDVARQRIALHIPAFRPHKSKKWTRAEEKILGTAEDKMFNWDGRWPPPQGVRLTPLVVVLDGVSFLFGADLPKRGRPTRKA